MLLRPKWIDILGQVLVLASAGFQLFVVGHWMSQNQNARHQELNLALARLEAGAIQDNTDVHAAKVRTSMMIATSERKAEFYSLIGGIIFVVGGALVIVARSIEDSSHSRT